MQTPNSILRVAVATPLRRCFDYLPPAGCDPESLPAGIRLRIPFGRSEQIGILLAVVSESDVPRDKLKPVTAILDQHALLDEHLLQLLQWAADYYHHPIGEVMQNAIPTLLREGKPPQVKGEEVWSLTEPGRQLDVAELKRAAKQQALLARLKSEAEMTASQLNQLFENWRSSIKKMMEHGWVAQGERPCLQTTAGEPEAAKPLNPEQEEALAAVLQQPDSFNTFLIHGVTGSGKTEVYLQLTRAILEQGRQVLILVPEIGLTPQLLQRFRQRFNVPIAMLHSGLSDNERLCAWLMAQQGEAQIIIGTRSAVFTPLARPGLLLIDEEHDASFKQQEGFRYSARDLAVYRAAQLQIPVVMGSATPALESLYNTEQGRYQLLNLRQRAGAAKPPRLDLLDIRGRPLQAGLSQEMIEAIQGQLARGGQVLLFLNRRGYAPTLMCHECGWVSHCQRCDAHMTLHKAQNRQRCHHCGSERPIPRQCPECGSLELLDIGQGTEKLADQLQTLFPDYGVIRIDRDSTRRKDSLQTLLDEIHKGEPQILIGTQMLAKGHHFPDVTLVGIIDADQGLFSADFRAIERLAQMITQVAGRAGRAEREGRVLIQTHHPEHPFWPRLLHGGYSEVARQELAERQQAQWPPYSYMALLRAEAVDGQLPMGFLHEVAQQALAIQQGVDVLGPIPSPMEKRAGRFRAQLIFNAQHRRPLHALLKQLMPWLESHKLGRKVRWSLDVDPIDTY